MIIDTTSSLSYTDADGLTWCLAAPTSVRQYPRTPYEAVLHGFSYLENKLSSPYPWTGRGMTAVARCFGLRTAHTGSIPLSVPGPRYSGIRQYRWVSMTYPDLAVPAPNVFTFGDNVPLGAVLYWDESGPDGGAVGIAAGYRKGVLQVLTATSDPVNSWGVTDVIPYGCAGWTAPVFYAGSSMDVWNLWDGDYKTLLTKYDDENLRYSTTLLAYSAAVRESKEEKI